MTMADKIVVLHDGRVEQIGAPLDLYDRPANLFVAGFIGSPAMNVLKGHIFGGGKPAFKAENGVEMPLASAPSASDGKPAAYGFRPEHLRIAQDGLPAQVVVVEPTGSETQVMLKLGGSDIVAVFRDRIAARPGEIIKIAPDLASVHLFDGESGQRLAA
jgi:multiple sugar transport system ATP-binding protein